MPNLRIFTASAMALLLAACASTPPVGGAPGLTVADTSALPAPDFSDFAPAAEEGIIRPLDLIAIEVFGVEELSREVRVGANGTLDYPLIGSVQASGLTTDELSLELENRFRSAYVRQPDVTSQITERNAQFVTVGGEVSRPGRFPVASSITLLEAVAIGGGLDEFAAREDVLVFRTVGDERYIGVYNLEGIARGNYADPTIYPNDIVMVGSSPGSRRLERILGIFTAIASPLILLERIVR